ncbi:helix-turn-helix transcriptional regulator [Priestia aryabhattai]|uniref:Helix-turn-helix transcriptional regulator n=1 Tax=Priestia aryabhattai TaxID=412384 RepID=A0AAX6NH72_PRIAR|nr:helix-turn-helix transcriptional regulator [Priestia aryabhattai]MDU9695127.1 helix-turn-helix transcriptional regulator [Priestia aryabhattai]
MDFTCELKAILTEREIKHEDFAKVVGVSPANLSALINNKSLPSFESAYRISEALEMDIKEIWISSKK